MGLVNVFYGVSKSGGAKHSMCPPDFKVEARALPRPPPLPTPLIHILLKNVRPRDYATYCVSVSASIWASCLGN